MPCNSGERRTQRFNQAGIVFLVWARHSIRADGISRRLGANLHMLNTSSIKHPLLFTKTLHILVKENPKIILCQSPPITCALVALIYRYFFGLKSTKILIDAHTGSIYNTWSKRITKLIMKKADGIIVTNEELQNDLSAKGVNSTVLEDPIPEVCTHFSECTLDVHNANEKRESYKIAVICSFAKDEPIREILHAASTIPGSEFYFTGDKSKAKINLLVTKSANVYFTGFLDYKDYLLLLKGSDVIMDLTKNDKTMVAGAYEAVALEKPLITSNWPPFTRYFNKGTIHIDNSVQMIRNAIETAINTRYEMSKEMQQLKTEKNDEWESKVAKFMHLITEK